MRVLIAGASGTIGRPLVAQLVAAGHTVVGMTRSDRECSRWSPWELNLWWLMPWTPPLSSTPSVGTRPEVSLRN